MPIKKGIKISSTKRGHHERKKKNFSKSKKLVHKEKQIRQNIFKKSKTALKKEQLMNGKDEKNNKNGDAQNNNKKRKNKQQPKGNDKPLPEFPKQPKVDDNHFIGITSDDEERIPQKRQRLDSTDSSDSEMSFESDNDEDSDSDNEEMVRKSELQQRKVGAMELENAKKMKEMLPIKTKSGVVPRLVEDLRKSDSEDGSESEDEDMEMEIEENEAEVEDPDTDEEFLTNQKNRQEKKSKKKLTTVELMIEREEELQKQKFRIGVICSGLLEKPEEKVKNIAVLLSLMSEYNSEKELNLFSIRKYAMISLVEVFKDINPDYKLGVVDLEQQKVKKDTLNRVAFENELLKNYKNYLRDLEEITKALRPKKYEARPSKERIELAIIAVQCLCEALLSNPYFNFTTNIAQLLVQLLNCHIQAVRKNIHETFMKIFKTDKRLDLTLHIVRNINQLVKRKSNFVFVEVVSCMIALQIKNINVNAEKEAELKQKKLEQHKSRLISMSKREKKRKKKLADLEKEMMETQAEENKQSKYAKLTDISKLVFTVYFRILKQSPNSRLLSVTLEGLAKFAHIINIEFFSDLIEVLNHLIENVDLGYREQIHCIQTVFTILSGQGEVLNIDPARFYTHLYKNILRVNAGKNHSDMESVIPTIENVLIRRRKNITHLRYLAFLKRLMSLSIQVLHNGSLGCLGIVKSALQLNSKLDILLDPENKVGSGKFDPEIIEPEFSNANCTSLFELALLKRHYHPTVIKFANHIAGGVQINSGLEPTLAKLQPVELLTQFDTSQMGFNPPIPPPPKKIKAKNSFGKYNFKLNDIEEICNRKSSSTSVQNGLNYDFYSQM